MPNIERAARALHRFCCEACSADAPCPYDGVTPWDEHKAKVILEAVNYRGAVDALREIRDNLGVPSEGYPAPVAHAWKIADDWLTANGGQ